MMLRILVQIFFNGCVELQTLDISSFKKLKNIGDHFCKNMLSLTSIKFPNTHSVTNIDNEFMSECPLLESIDLNFINVHYGCETLNEYFMSANYGSIQYIFLPKINFDEDNGWKLGFPLFHNTDLCPSVQIICPVGTFDFYKDNIYEQYIPNLVEQINN